MSKTGEVLNIRHSRQVALWVTIGLLWLSCLVAPTTALAENAVSDLSLSHWAIGSLRVLARTGLVDATLLPGNEAVNVTRLEVALAVSQALGNLRAATSSSSSATDELDLAKLVAAYNASPPRGRNMGSREIDALRMLVTEFRPELDILGITVISTEDLSTSQDSTVASAFVDLDALVGSIGPQVMPIGSTGSDSNGSGSVVPTSDLGSISQPPSQDGSGRGQSALPVSLNPTGVSAQAGTDLSALSALPTESHGLFISASSVDEQVMLDSALAKNRVLAVGAEMNAKSGRVSALKKVFVVEPSLKVSSEFLANPKASPETGSVSVEAAVKVGEVKLGANVRNVSGLDSPTVNPLEEQGKSGYDFTLKLGKVTLLTGYEKLLTTSEIENRRIIGVNYAFSDIATLRAGYQFVDIDSVTPKAKANTTVGVDFNLSNSATLRADFQLQGSRDWSGIFSGSEGQKATAGVEWRLPWNAKVRADYELYRQTSAGSAQPIQQTASVGLGYNFMQNGTLLLGYRLIDFGTGTESKDTQSGLTAGVSVRF